MVDILRCIEGKSQKEIGQFIFDYFPDRTWERWLDISGLNIDAEFLRHSITGVFIRFIKDNEFYQEIPSKGNTQKPLKGLHKKLEEIIKILNDPKVMIMLQAAEEGVTEEEELQSYISWLALKNRSERDFEKFSSLQSYELESLQLSCWLDVVQSLSQTSQEALKILPSAKKLGSFDKYLIQTLMECWHFVTSDYPAISPESNFIVLVHDILRESGLCKKNTSSDHEFEKLKADALVKNAQDTKVYMQSLPLKTWENIYSPYEEIQTVCALGYLTKHLTKELSKLK